MIMSTLYFSPPTPPSLSTLTSYKSTLTVTLQKDISVTELSKAAPMGLNTDSEKAVWQHDHLANY